MAGKSINILLLLVRPESEMHMDLSLASTFGGGPLVRVKEPEVGKLGGGCAGGEEERND